MEERVIDHRTPGLLPTLTEIPFFSGIGEETLNEILKHTTILECQPGEEIVEEGDDDDSLLFLLDGKVRVIKEGKTIAAAWDSGEMLGEMAQLHGGVRSATLHAVTVVYCLKVRDGFLDSLAPAERNAYYANLYRFLAKLLAERLERTSDKLVRAEKALAERSTTGS